MSENDLKKRIEDLKEIIEVAIYELEILHTKVKPTKHSSIDSHFKRIIDNLKER